MVEDPLASAELGFHLERVRTSNERFFLDGPISERIAVIDRHPASGLLALPVRWEPGKTGGKFQQPASPEGQMALSAFGIVLETLEMFERPDVLGHRVTWAFGSPQLLVVPRAGIWQNAFYDRFARALQFFSFDSGDGRRVHTANSRDIVSHEMGHAIVDALLPALYDALTPQTQALHEAIADLTAMSMAFKSQQIRDWLVRNKKADLQGDSPITQLAQEFATRRGDSLQTFHPLRDLFNNKTMDTLEDPTEPHALCEVLTGAVWAALMRNHDHALQKAREDPRGESLLGAKLRISGERFARILFRALDYLPPAEATFVDYARALLCSDTVAVPEDSSGYREVLKQEFQKRGIVQSLDEFGCAPAVESVQADPQALIESDWAAFQFADAHRDLLGIPAGCPFRLFPRYLAKRQYWRGGTSTETGSPPLGEDADVEVAQAASHTKEMALSTRFNRLTTRLGDKMALRRCTRPAATPAGRAARIRSCPLRCHCQTGAAETRRPGAGLAGTRSGSDHHPGASRDTRRRAATAR